MASGLNGCVLPWDTAMSTAARASARASKVSSKLAKMLLCSCEAENNSEETVKSKKKKKNVRDTEKEMRQRKGHKYIYQSAFSFFLSHKHNVKNIAKAFLQKQRVIEMSMLSKRKLFRVIVEYMKKTLSARLG